MTGQAASPRVPARTQNPPPQKFVTRRFLEHGNHQPGNCIGRQSLDKATFRPRSSTASDGQKMEYMEFMKGPDLQPLCKLGFSNEAVDSSKASTKFQAPTHVSLLNSKTYQRTDKSHMAKLSVTKSLTKKKKNA
jgi:hypothetical protein